MLFCAGDYTKEAIVQLLSSDLKTTKYGPRLRNMIVYISVQISSGYKSEQLEQYKM